MKKLTTILIIFTMLLTFGCYFAGEEGEAGETGADGGGGLKVFDSTGAFLGYSEDGLRLISVNGHQYELNWDGSFNGDDFNYSETDGAGTIYRDLDGGVVYEKNVSYHSGTGTFYIPANPTAQGYATSTSNYNYVSKWEDWTKTYNNSGGTAQSVYEVKTISRAEAGIPETITPPITYGL
jgi:hypothetical protein